MNSISTQTRHMFFSMVSGSPRESPATRPFSGPASEKILPAENEIGLLCEGDTLTPYINGTQLRRQQEKTFGLTSGKIGVAASAFEDGPVAIAYDWVQAALP